MTPAASAFGGPAWLCLHQAILLLLSNHLLCQQGLQPHTEAQPNLLAAGASFRGDMQSNSLHELKGEQWDANTLAKKPNCHVGIFLSCLQAPWAPLHPIIHISE
jgi:hypothetical protein